MHSINLITKVDEDSGLVGISIPGTQPNINPCHSAFMLAHDVVEHMNPRHCMGYVWDEIQALGAIQYIRHQFEEARIQSDLEYLMELESYMPFPDNPPPIDPEAFPDMPYMPPHWLQHLQIGYNRAQRKYPDPLDGWETFNHIRNLDHQFTELMPGETFTLIYNREGAMLC